MHLSLIYINSTYFECRSFFINLFVIYSCLLFNIISIQSTYWAISEHGRHLREVASDMAGNVYHLHFDRVFVCILYPWLDLRCYQYCSEHSKEIKESWKSHSEREIGCHKIVNIPVYYQSTVLITCSKHESSFQIFKPFPRVASLSYITAFLALPFLQKWRFSIHFIVKVWI